MYMAVALLVWVAWIINIPHPPKGEANKIQKGLRYCEGFFSVFSVNPKIRNPKIRNPKIRNPL
jgi:hypothetical protein